MPYRTVYYVDQNGQSRCDKWFMSEDGKYFLSYQKVYQEWELVYDSRD